MERVNYKWMLRKSGRKMRCPKCGQMRFVPYVLAADGVTLAGAEFGRCDREQNCGYQKYPNGKEAPEPVYIERKPEEPLRFYPSAVMIDPKTNLFDYVAGLIGTAHAINVWERYKIGRDGSRTVFWQIALDGTVRAGKSIPYKPNGHRDKEDPMPASWLHTSKAWKEWRTGTKLEQCFFGEHLLKQMPDAPVVIVESEKTAAIMSEVSRKWVWLASGGSQGLKNEDKNKALKGRDVWLMPDHGQFWNWATIAHANGWQCFDTIEKYPIFAGCDILDLFEAGAFGTDLLKYKKRHEN